MAGCKKTGSPSRLHVDRGEVIAMLNFTCLPNRKCKFNPSKSCGPDSVDGAPTLLSAVSWTGDAGDNNWDSARELEHGQRSGIGR